MGGNRTWRHSPRRDHRIGLPRDLVLHQTRARGPGGGRIVVYGDSNCIDGAHLSKPCYWLLDALLEYTSAGHLPQLLRDNAGPSIKPAEVLPSRMVDNQLARYSK